VAGKRDVTGWDKPDADHLDQPHRRFTGTEITADVDVLDEHEETGAKRYRYVRTGEDHFSLAFTYAWMAITNSFAADFRAWMRLMKAWRGE